jgi:toluene monooxygenase electron transfer component
MIAVHVSDRRGKRETFFAKEGQRLLHAGLMGGIGLPHECATGTCGNCKATVVSGDGLPLWPDAPGAKVCRKAGEVLLCQTAAASDLELALPSAFIPRCRPQCREVRGRIAERKILTPEVGLFEIALDEPLDYLPGQFVLLSGLGVQGPRAYSMTHHAPREARLRFLIRLNPSGHFSRSLFERDIQNDRLDVFGPLGRATFDCGEERPIVAVAGGSGVAGVMSIIRHALAAGYFQRHPSRVFFGLRDADSSYLLDEFSAFERESEGCLQVTIAFSEGSCSAEFAAKWPAIDFKHGFVHDVMRDCLASNDRSELMTMKNPLFFVGGPPLMVNATMKSLMSDCKVSPTEIRYDRFN